LTTDQPWDTYVPSSSNGDGQPVMFVASTQPHTASRPSTITALSRRSHSQRPAVRAGPLRSRGWSSGGG
jgi:hypothetical protein